MAAAVSCVLLLSACTANDGVATTPSETADPNLAASDPYAASVADQTLDTVYGSQL